MRALASLVFPLMLLAAAACGGDDYADRMATEHAGESPTATPATEGVQGTAVGGEVVYPIGDGETATGYLAKPADADASAPGVIVIHEWWGLNDNIRRMADQLAEQGYAALAVDLYGGEVAESAERARELTQAASEDIDGARDNLRGAYAYLSDSLGTPRVGSIGWCFGGGMSLQAALAMPDMLDAVVIYYGRVTDDADQLAPLGMPVLGHFGAEDQGIPPESARAFERTMNELGKDAEVYVYDGAGHAFANPSGQRYQKEAAETAWARTTAFFAENLRP